MRSFLRHEVFCGQGCHISSVAKAEASTSEGTELTPKMLSNVESKASTTIRTSNQIGDDAWHHGHAGAGGGREGPVLGCQAERTQEDRTVACRGLLKSTFLQALCSLFLEAHTYAFCGLSDAGNPSWDARVEGAQEKRAVACRGLLTSMLNWLIPVPYTNSGIAFRSFTSC